MTISGGVPDSGAKKENWFTRFWRKIGAKEIHTPQRVTPADKQYGPARGGRRRMK